MADQTLRLHPGWEIILPQLQFPRFAQSVLCGLAIATSIGSMAAPTITFGDDPGAGSSANLVDSKAARDSFLASLVGMTVGLQTFDGLSVPTSFPAGNPLTFAGSSVTAALSGGFLRDGPFNARFPVSGTQYFESDFNVRITFSSPVAAFGSFVTDADELNNNPATVTINGQTLTQAEIDARPFDSVDGIFRVVTERSPGVFEVLDLGNVFPATDSSGYFFGVVDTANPLTNIILINGTAGLDLAFRDGFGYDDFYVGTLVAPPIPEPETWVLMGAGLAALGAAARRRRKLS